jgi:hypothetical protein
MISQSFQTMKLVPSDLLQNRVETVQELLVSDLEQYEIVKDVETGEHYLHYAYLHINVAGGGVREYYHQLMPLETDDVLAIVLGEQAYTYPDHWRKPFLRNGPDQYYVWFDPQGVTDGEEQERIADELRTKLLEFKEQGRYDEESVRRMLEMMDKLLDGDGTD